MSEELACPIDLGDGYVFGCTLDGEGGGRELGGEEAAKIWCDKAGPVWIHLNGRDPNVAEWIHGEGGLTEPTASAILSKESRPRFFHGANGSIVILRGINLNAGSEPEDMVALRMWSDGTRLLTIREEKLVSVREVHERIIGVGRGPTDIPDLYLALIDQLTSKIASVVLDYDDQLDRMEEAIDRNDEPSKLRGELSDIRSEMVGIRRYIAPQREALHQLMGDPPRWFERQHILELRELIDRSQRHLEEIDAGRERAMVLKDEVGTLLDERMNKNMYVLSIVAAIFLPLGFLTGLLGINVGGMPGVNDGHAFWITVGGLVVILALELLLFRLFKWL